MSIKTSKTDIDFSVARPGTDVVLVAEGKEIHVNKEFLSTFSPYFNTLLLSPNFAESSSERITIDHDYNQLLQCIQIVHENGISASGSMSLSEVEGLLKSADRFDLPVVRLFCESEMKGMPRDSQCVEKFFLACRHNLLSVKAAFLRQTDESEWTEWLKSKTMKRIGCAGNRFSTPMWKPEDEQDVLMLSKADLLRILFNFESVHQTFHLL